jgi:hypothetical protein
MTDPADATPDDAGTRGDTAGSPDRYVQGEAVTLSSLLDDLGALGFTGQFDVHGGGVRCLRCRVTTATPAVAVEDLRRLEGASDPADMLAVVALRCPHCGTRGTLVLNYGPEATPEDAEVLGLLPARD